MGNYGIRVAATRIPAPTPMQGQLGVLCPDQDSLNRFALAFTRSLVGPQIETLSWKQPATLPESHELRTLWTRRLLKPWP